MAREALGDVAPPPQAAPESPPPPAPDPQPRRPHYLVVGAALLVALVALFGGMRLVQLEIERRRAGAALALPTVTVVPTVAPTPGATAAPAMPEVTVEHLLDPDSPQGREVRAAERRYWEVYGDALYTLDTSHLSEVAAGEELNRITARIAQLKADGYAVQLRIEHVARIFNASESKAYIYDKSTDRSLLLKADTKEPVPASGPDPAVGESGEHVYTYERIDGIWKVTSGFRVLNREG